MHYLENFPAEDLGLSHDEANLVWSSVYESRIPWYAFWESKAAVNSWNKYGTGKFYQSIRTANGRLRTNQRSFDSVGKRLNYAFMEAEYKGEEVIINLYDSQDMFNSFPAVAHYINNPKKIARKRLILQLAQLGMSFLSIPDFIKSIAGNYMKSHYQKQKLTEGALYGYFETINNLEGKEMIKAQYLNPFDPLKEL